MKVNADQLGAALFDQESDSVLLLNWNIESSWWISAVPRRIVEPFLRAEASFLALAECEFDKFTVWSNSLNGRSSQSYVCSHEKAKHGDIGKPPFAQKRITSWATIKMPRVKIYSLQQQKFLQTFKDLGWAWPSLKSSDFSIVIQWFWPSEPHHFPLPGGQPDCSTMASSRQSKTPK
jgi:hypothetical protein